MLSATRVRHYSCGYDFAIRHLPQQYWEKVWSTKLLGRVIVLRKLSCLNSLTQFVLPERKYLEDLFVHSRFKHSLSENGDSSGIKGTVHHTKIDKLLEKRTLFIWNSST
jgi:hypothetical protein